MKFFKQIKTNKGMSYVELIVVLSIFAILSSVSIFSYKSFQASVDIRNLASDIASKIVEAQKSSLNGVWSQLGGPDWKPSYGVSFSSLNTIDSNSTNSDYRANQEFIYFVDLDMNGSLDSSACLSGGECLEKVFITKGNFISRIDKCSEDPCPLSAPIELLDVTFKRPNSGAIFSPELDAGFEYFQITISSSDQNKQAVIKIYPSGRVQVN